MLSCVALPVGYILVFFGGAALRAVLAAVCDDAKRQLAFGCVYYVAVLGLLACGYVV